MRKKAFKNGHILYNCGKFSANLVTLARTNFPLRCTPLTSPRNGQKTVDDDCDDGEDDGDEAGSVTRLGYFLTFLATHF